MHPVGPLNSKVYWVRRVSIVVLAVAVLIGLVWFLASRTSRSSAVQDPAAAAVNTSAAPTLTGVLAASSAATRSTVPSASPSPSPSAALSRGSASGSAPVSVAAAPTPTVDPAAEAAAAAAAAASAAEAAAAAAAAAAPATEAPPATTPVGPPPAPVPPPPSYDAQGKLICPDSSVTVTATTSAPSFAAGSQPIVGMVITNTGTETCQRDVSGTLQAFTVLAADGSRMWSTGDCFPGEGTEVRELTPGQTLKYTIKWSGTTSQPGCAGDRSLVPPGDYSLVAQLGGLSSPPAAFAITG